MSAFRLGLGGPRILTLGFSSAPEDTARGGSYVTLGFGQGDRRHFTLGLSPGHDFTRAPAGSGHELAVALRCDH